MEDKVLLNLTASRSIPTAITCYIGNDDNESNLVNTYDSLNLQHNQNDLPLHFF